MFKKKGPRPHVDKEWEKSHTTIKKHYKHIIFPLGGLALAGVTATAIFLPLYIRSKYEDGLGNFMDEGGTVPAFQKDKPITYVAMGDSITAGYNGFFHGSDDAPQSKDYISYADFLAQDLKNAGLLKDYKNYAKSGDTIWDTNGLIDESQAVNHAIKNADFITMSISSNDLLGSVTALGLPFATSVNKLLGNVQLPNHLRDAIFDDTNKGIGGTDTNKLISGAIKKAADLLYKGKTLGVMDIRDGYQKTILDIVQRGLMILTRDLHQAAPNAHIKFIMPEFPLIGISKSLETEPTENTGKSVQEFYEQDFFDAVKKGIKADYTSFEWFHNGFKDYIENIDSEESKLKAKVDQLTKEIADAEVNQDKFLYAASEMQALPGKHGGYPLPTGLIYKKSTEITDINSIASTFTDAQLKTIFLSKELLNNLGIDTNQSIDKIRDEYVGGINDKRNLLLKYKIPFNQYQSVKDRYKDIKTDRIRTIITNEFMNDFADIHPSTRGHQVMGNYLFKKLLPDLISKPTKPIEELYQMAIPYEDDGEIKPFEELDQIDWSNSNINGELHLINQDLDSSTIANISRAINKIVTQHPDGLASPLKDILEVIKPMISGDSSISTDVYKINPAEGMLDDIFKVKGSTPGFDAQGFLGSLVKDAKSDRDTVEADDSFWAPIATILNQELVVSPDHVKNIAALVDDLKGFNMANIFSDASLNSISDFKAILTEIGITKEGEYASSISIDWSAITAKLTDSNHFVKDYEGSQYLQDNVKTLGDLLSILQRSKTESLFRTFILDKVPTFLADGRTADFKGDLPSMYDRSIKLADDWGLTDLSNALTKSKLGEAKLEDLFKAMAKYSSFSETQLKGAQSSMSFKQIIDLVNGDINKGSDAAVNAAAIKVIKNAFDAYTADTKVTMNSGFQALFNALNIVLPH